jgi:hypothetical protein
MARLFLPVNKGGVIPLSFHATRDGRLRQRPWTENQTTVPGGTKRLFGRESGQTSRFSRFSAFLCQ